MGAVAPHDTTQPHVVVCVDYSAGSYSRGLLHGIAEYVATHRSWSLFVNTRKIVRGDRVRLRNWNSDGILLYAEDLLLSDRLRRSGIPTVSLGGPRSIPGLAQVRNDEGAIGRLAAQHLVECRLTHFAFCGYTPSVTWCQQRRDAFTEVAIQAGVVSPSFVGLQRLATPAEFKRNQQRLIQWICQLPKPVGIMACSDFQAQRILDACRKAGVVVPEEVALIGVGNDEEICLLAQPPLTSVQDNPRRIGYEAAALLDQLMLQRRRARQVEPLLVPPAGVVVRHSTDITATADRLIAEAVQCIYERACQGLTVKQLLQELPISRSEFYRRFQSVVGRSPHEQILHVRFERVKNLLAQTTFSLKKIAELSGFEHREYLTVAFNREFGMSPGEFRRLQKGVGGHT